MLELKHIKKYYHVGDSVTKALDDVSVAFRKQEFVAILGPSGSGKTTMLNGIGGLDIYDSGDLVINGKSTKDFSEADWDAYRNNSVGFIFQSYNIIGHLSILDNVEMGMTLSGVPNEEKEKKAREALERVGLGPHINKKPNQLSGGQLQRVAIARALASDPEILISDEATSALDPKTTTEILNLLGRLNKELGITIVIITHEMDAIKQICNRVAVMENGQLIEEGSLLTIFGQPKEKLTKDFVNTSTHIGSVLDEIRESGIVDKLSGRLIELNYIGDSTNEPIVVELYKRFEVEANILFSNIERLQNTTVGIMLFALTGEDQKVEEAIKYLNSLNVNVKEISLEKEGK